MRSEPKSQMWSIGVIVVVGALASYAAFPYLKLYFSSTEEDIEIDGCQSTRIRHEGNI